MDSSFEMDEELEAGMDELQGFDDFTLVSAWERLISEIEGVCRMWLADGSENLLAKGAERVKASKNLHHVNADFTYGIKTYRLEYFFQVNNSHDDIGEWRDGLHYLQLWFGVKDFLIICPQSMSGVVLDAPEATKLLSAVAIALSNCGSNWPAFVPVHDPTRKEYKGIQNMKTTLTRRFEADRIGSQVPIKLMHLEGLYELFVSKLAFASSDFAAPSVKVHFTMRLTYQTPVPGYELEQQEERESQIPETGVNIENELFNNRQWDDDCPWTEWYSVEDPIKGFELITIWSKNVVESSVEMAEFENVSSYEADKWFLVPMTLMDLDNTYKDYPVGFASRLHALVEAFRISFEAQFMEDFAAAENPNIQSLTTGAIVPPPTVLDRVLKDLFHEGPLPSKVGENCHKHAQAVKGAPLESLFSQFCLHSLWFGSCNIRAISVLWIEFVREVRWCWEELQPLPRMPTNGTVDLASCLVHQKLQMLAVCITKKISERRKHDSGGEGRAFDQSHVEVEEIPSLGRNGERQHISKDILDGERGR
eukprot:Gb_39184 [translate_table: standard]